MRNFQGFLKLYVSGHKNVKSYATKGNLLTSEMTSTQQHKRTGYIPAEMEIWGIFLNRKSNSFVWLSWVLFKRFRILTTFSSFNVHGGHPLSPYCTFINLMKVQAVLHKKVTKNRNCLLIFKPLGLKNSKQFLFFFLYM